MAEHIIQPEPVQKIRLQPASNTPAWFDSLPDIALVDSKTIAWLFGCSENTVWRRASSGVLPTPLKVSANQTRWRVGEIRKVLAELSA
jgi:predicted DNA-binding transcriptional regulator AlpA